MSTSLSDFFKLFGPRKKQTPHVSRAKRAQVIERDGFRCVYCKAELTADVVTIDHVIPKTKGGGSQLSNLVVACRSCNSSKGNRRSTPYARGST